MHLPAYWWLLAIAVVGQGGMLAWICLGRLLGKAVQPLSRGVRATLYVAGVGGFAYGVVQSDPVFCLGQACLLIIYFKTGNS